MRCATPGRAAIDTAPGFKGRPRAGLVKLAAARCPMAEARAAKAALALLDHRGAPRNIRHDAPPLAVMTPTPRSRNTASAAVARTDPVSRNRASGSNAGTERLVADVTAN